MDFWKRSNASEKWLTYIGWFPKKSIRQQSLSDRFLETNLCLSSISNKIKKLWAHGSVVERSLHMRKVGGSIPPAPTKTQLNSSQKAIELCLGARGRNRTFCLFIISEVLCHWATRAYFLVTGSARCFAPSAKPWEILTLNKFTLISRQKPRHWLLTHWAKRPKFSPRHTM